MKLHGCGAVLLLTLLCALPRANAQAPDRPPPNEFGVWGGFAPFTSRLRGDATDRQMVSVGLRYSIVMLKSRSVSFDYVVDLIPVETIRQPVSNTHEFVYGGGLNPFGLRWTFRRQHTWQPFAGVSGGLLWSVRPIPVDSPLLTRFNFTFDYFSVGLRRYNAARTRSWIFGFKIQHFSNAGLGLVNPGVDEDTFFAGYSFYK